MAGRPIASYVVPASDEEAHLPATLASVRALETTKPYEVVVVALDDATAAVAREAGARVLTQRGSGVADARHEGALAAEGRWLAFLDADTVVRPAHLDAMVESADRGGLVAASSRCRVTGPARAKLPEWIVNHVFPRLSRPILPGFNLLVEREAYFAHGGFPDVPNEDVEFSRRLGRTDPTGYCPRTLVSTSGRRIAESGLTGTLAHYVRLEFGRLRAASPPTGAIGRGSDAED